jgi:hypothetical protein
LVEVFIVEAVADFFQTLAELISTPSLDLELFISVSDTKRRSFASCATRRGIVSSNAPNSKAKSNSTRQAMKQAQMMVVRLLFGRSGAAG